MNDPRSRNPVSPPPHFVARTFLIKEWPYLLVLVLALGMSRVLLKLAKRSLPSMILRDFEL